VAAVLALTATVGLRWLYGEHTLAGYGNEAGGAVKVGTTVYSLGMVGPASDEPKELNLRSVKPRIAQNSADAIVRVLTCVVNGNVAVTLGPTARSCSSTTPFAPGTQTLGNSIGNTYIIVSITPRRPAGTVRIEGLDVSFQDGIRHGRQHTGLAIVISSVR
jgi:hypothetical protein